MAMENSRWILFANFFSSSKPNQSLDQLYCGPIGSGGLSGHPNISGAHFGDWQFKTNLALENTRQCWIFQASSTRLPISKFIKGCTQRLKSFKTCLTLANRTPEEHIFSCIGIPWRCECNLTESPVQIRWQCYRLYEETTKVKTQI